MLKARLLTALCLIAGLGAVLYFLQNAWAAIVFAVIATLAAREWAGLMKLSQVAGVALILLVLLGCFLVWQSFAIATPNLWTLAVLFWLVGAPLWLWRGWRLSVHRMAGFALGGVLIVAAWSALVGLHARSPGTLLAVMAIVWIADSAAYFAGRALGRRKLAPKISPGKTWEGVAGGMLAVLSYGIFLHAYVAELRQTPLFLLLFVLFVLAAMSIVGDLFESLAKRQVEMKDSGSLLPGHGGVLDRIDSLLPTLPFAALMLEGVAR